MHFAIIYVIKFFARSKVIKGVKLEVKWSFHRAKILNNVRFCSGLLHIDCNDEPNKSLNNIHEVKGQQKVIMGHWTFSPYTDFFSIFSNCKTNTVNMLNIVRDTKVSTVTPPSDPPLRGQRSKGHFHIMAIYNFIIRARFTKIYQQIPYPHMSL